MKDVVGFVSETPFRMCVPGNPPEGRQLYTIVLLVMGCGRVKTLVDQLYLTLCDPKASSLPSSLSMGFTRQEYWSG